MPNKSMMDVPHTATVTAEVNAPLPETTTLYSLDGRSVLVDTKDVEYWLSRGLTRTKLDLDALTDNFLALVEPAVIAVRAYVKGVRKDGVIDTEDTAAKAIAEIAMDQFTQAWGAIDQAINTIYPVRQYEEATDVSE